MSSRGSGGGGGCTTHTRVRGTVEHAASAVRQFRGVGVGVGCSGVMEVCMYIIRWPR